MAVSVGTAVSSAQKGTSMFRGPTGAWKAAQSAGINAPSSIDGMRAAASDVGRYEATPTCGLVVHARSVGPFEARSTHGTAVSAHVA
jgi:hypothetical protein